MLEKSYFKTDNYFFLNALFLKITNKQSFKNKKTQITYNY